MALVVKCPYSSYEAASFIRRFLQHPQFKTKSKRMGKVVRITHHKFSKAFREIIGIAWYKIRS